MKTHKLSSEHQGMKRHILGVRHYNNNLQALAPCNLALGAVEATHHPVSGLIHYK